MREAKIAELEILVGGRTDKEKKVLLGVSDETFELLLKYARLAQFKTNAEAQQEIKPSVSKKKEKA